MTDVEATTWAADWLWSLPLIVASIRVLGLGVVNSIVTRQMVAGRGSWSGTLDARSGCR